MCLALGRSLGSDAEVSTLLGLIAGLAVAGPALLVWARRRSIRHAQTLAAARALGGHLSAAMRAISEAVHPGLSTATLDSRAATAVVEAGLVPYFQGYGQYPAATTMSLNEEIINTLPSRRELESGDILKAQIGVSDGEGFACQAWTFGVGPVSAARRQLVGAAHSALTRAIEAARPGARVGDVETAIHSSLIDDGLRGSAHYVGYQMGRQPRQRPRICCNGPGPDRETRLRPGMVLQIVVLAHAGSPEAHVADDTWNVKSADGSDSALLSHMVFVDKNGPLVLTDDPAPPGSAISDSSGGPTSKVASSEAGTAAEGRFWSWFSSNSQRVFSFERDRDAVFDELSAQLERVAPGLTFEIGSVEAGRRPFIISADGDRALFPAVQRLAGIAPQLAQWEIIPFRPPRPEPSIVDFEGTRLRSQDVWFKAEPDGAKTGLTIYLPAVAPTEIDRMHAASFILLDVMLGEYVVETEVGFIEWAELPGEPTAEGLEPISSLPQHFDRDPH